MTVDEPTENEPEAGPSSSQTQTDVTPKLDHKYFDEEMGHAPPKKTGKSRIELCKTLLPVPESPMSPPGHEESQFGHSPYAACLRRLPRLLPRAKRKAIRERQ